MVLATPVPPLSAFDLLLLRFSVDPPPSSPVCHIRVSSLVLCSEKFLTGRYLPEACRTVREPGHLLCPDGVSGLGSGRWPEGSGVASSPAPDPHLHRSTASGRGAFTRGSAPFFWKLKCPGGRGPEGVSAERRTMGGPAGRGVAPAGVRRS